MNYRNDKYGNPLSVLGYGCMRFPKKAGKTDLKKTEEQILLAIKEGVNYFDTAYIYAGSESALGEILQKHNLRKSVNIATKLPHYLIKNRQVLDKIFQEQLHRLKTDYIDYYLMHMLTDTATWQRLCDMGIKEWIAEKKQSGQIKQIGFSYHGNSDTFCNLVDVYDWDFCMIQYNYMDEHSQAGKRGLKYAHAKGLPVMIMEPLRGGRLVNRLPEEAKQIFAHHRPKRSPADWAFRWLFNQPEVSVVLSGMNSTKIINENVKTASESYVGEITKEDFEMLSKVTNAINKGMKVGCTGCGYCMPCPAGVDIAGTFSAYNRKYSEGNFAALKEYFMCTALRKNTTTASKCIGCGKCEKHCPQNIKIRTELKKASKDLEVPIFKIAQKVAKTVVKF